MTKTKQTDLNQNINYMAKESIKFYEDRTFGDLIGAPFQFVIQEFKNLFLTILKYSSPFLLLTLVFFVLGY